MVAHVSKVNVKASPRFTWLDRYSCGIRAPPRLAFTGTRRFPSYDSKTVKPTVKLVPSDTLAPGRSPVRTPRPKRKPDARIAPTQDSPPESGPSGKTRSPVPVVRG